MDFYTESSNILLLELSSQVTLDECSFSDTSVTDEDEFEFWDLSLRLSLHCN